ncbi:hypothetical protein GFY24_14615 [Nocardia sp. SYP-A9097]|uniref:FtsK/SpoIIIE domain-containing protein n=1 Tax=Nocardia sp. SYP-A9097 TaxID=2663237 RepID=UPI00129AEB70|nr:FtsK/SpoIIIE domain-containing protein [Nocardia sp. SYP-A9097]MRH88662.1 hypothetical protein [Nocardia sp. SYP-A9097]
MADGTALHVDISGAQGNVAVVGGSPADQSAKLRELVTGIAAVHSPEQVQFYGIDFGWGMGDLADLPHVGSIACRRADGLIRRTLQELLALLRRRRERFALFGVESMAEFRRDRYAALLAGSTGDPLLEDGFGDVILVVDGWDMLRVNHPTLDRCLYELVAYGLPFGIHVLLASTRRLHLPPAVRETFGTLINLWHDHRAERGVQPPIIVAPLLGAMVTLPIRPDTYRVPEIQVLPFDVTRDEVQRQARALDIHQGSTRVVIGIAESELRPQVLDFDIDPHLMAFAETESGKTTLLRNIIRGITDHSTPARARILALDYCRTLLGEVDDAFLAGYATTPQTSAALVADLARYIARRVPGPDLTPRRIRERDWWTGPEIYLFVDDYERVTRPWAANPLAPLLELLPLSKHLGLHLVLTRCTGGATRAFATDPVLAELRAQSPSVLLMSGNPDEGAFIADTRPMSLPPGRAILITRTTAPEFIQLAATSSHTAAPLALPPWLQSPHAETAPNATRELPPFPPP